MPSRLRSRFAIATGASALLAVAVACAPVTPPPPPVAPPPPLRTGTQNGSLGGCPVFPADNWWNEDISAAPVHADSAAIIDAIQGNGGNQSLHADFGGNGEYGIPYVTVPAGEPKVPVKFTDWPEESNPGPYPIPLGAPIEGGSDRHVIAIRQGECKLYELYNARSVGGTRWDASNGAVFDLRSNALRPAGWTSADAAGLPIFPGLARYGEVSLGSIRHALRVTFSETRRAYITPARHYASSDSNPLLPAMGMRLRLKSTFDSSAFPPQARVILEALKKYGLIVADNGSDWFITGAADTRWNDTQLDWLKSVSGNNFEVVYTGEPTVG